MHSTRRKRDRGAAASSSSRGRSRGRRQSSHQSKSGAAKATNDVEDIHAEQVPPRSASSTPAPGDVQEDIVEESVAMDIDISKDQGANGVADVPQSLPPGSDEGNREEKIKALLLHRKTLLNRMKRCGTAAETRLRQNEQMPRKKRPIESSTGEAEAKSEVRPDEGLPSEKEEIDEYQALTRLANQTAKRQRSTSDVVPEKKSSVALRRGSGVGRRMNAAISSLLPGAHPDSFIESEMGMTPLARPPSSVGQPSGQLLNIKQSSLSKRVGGAGMKRSRPGLGSRASSSSAFHSHGAAGALHPGARSTFPRPELLVPQSKVDFPEAQSLREQRAGVRAKLSALLLERKRRLDEKNATAKTHSTLPDPAYAWRPAPTMPSKLPNRRKTHWDYLLEEMRWMSSDFIEERKWKQSTARTLASAVVAKNLDAVSPVSARTGGEKSPSAFFEKSATKGKSMEDDDVDMEDVAEEGGSAAVDHSLREYVHPSPLDLKPLRSVSSVLSAMVSELWDVTVESGAFSKSDEPHILALERFRSIEKSLKQEINQAEAASGLSGVPKGNTSEEKKEATPELNSETPARVDESANVYSNGFIASPSRNETQEQISEKIDSLAERLSSRNAKRGRPKPSEEGMPLTDAQKLAIEFVEFVWSGDEPGGAVLDGSSGSGKTLVTCSLLWQNRELGPQLLVCSPARLIRWTHEFQRFPEIKVRLYGLTGGISSPLLDRDRVQSYGPGDIVICEFSSLFSEQETSTAAKLDLSSFYSVTIDSRHPLESIASSGNKWQEETPSAPGAKVRRTPSERLVPALLLSRSWWAAVLSSLSQVNARRVFIENRGYLKNFAEYGIKCDAITERQHIEFIAAKSAFIVGPGIFSDNKSSTIQHKVVSWAKHCVKKSKNDTEKSRFERVLRHLLVTISPFLHSIEDQKVERGTLELANWELHPCVLPRIQREKYDECCQGLRGALSLGSVSDGTDSQTIKEQSYLAASALSKLRELCVHAHPERILGKTSSRSIVGGLSSGSPFARHISRSASQPDGDIVVEILNGSAKFRELIRILTEMRSFNPKSAALVETLMARVDQPMSPQQNPKGQGATKVAILATMPEAQLLTSRLLSAIGVPHQLLLRELITSDSSSFARANVGELAWIESQIALSEFNAGLCILPVEDADDTRDSISPPVGMVPCDVLITSPMTVGSDYGGLGIESADLVICLDDDWSGRGEFLMDRIAHRCNLAWNRSLEAKKHGSEQCLSGGRLVRLVCENTCEEKFFSGLDDPNLSVDEQVRERFRWRANIFGCLTLSATDDQQYGAKENNGENTSSIVPERDALLPGQSILRLRNKNLSNVLCTTYAEQPGLTSGRPMLFLPSVIAADGSTPSTANLTVAVSLLHGLLDLENRLCCLDSKGLPLASRTDHAYTNILPPLPESLPEAVLARHDLTAISTRSLIEKLGIAFGSAPGLMSAPIGGASTGGARPLIMSGISPELVSSDSGDLADAWQRSGLSSKPGDMASSLLMYTSPSLLHSKSLEPDDASTEADGSNGQTSEAPKSGAQDLVISRINAFAEAFVKSRVGRYVMVRDGNQGAEPLVYFPPQFPGILRATKRARHELQRVAALRTGSPLQATISQSAQIMDLDESRKRKAAETVRIIERNSKRPRLDSKAVAVSSDTVDASQYEAPSGSAHPGVSTRPGGSVQAASVVTEDEASRGDNVSYFLDLGEDYGLLGMGALASPEDSVREASLLEVDSLACSGWNDPFEPLGLSASSDFTGMLACDPDEADASTNPDFSENKLDSMLLFVTKRSLGMGSNPFASGSSSSGVGGLPWGQLSTAAAANPTLYSSINGDGAAGSRRARKRGHDFSADSLAFGGASVYRVAAKLQVESARQKAILAMLGRQGQPGVTLFHSPHFRLASVRIRNRVLLRASQAALASSNALGSGPGFPLPSEKGTDWSTEASRRRRWSSGVLKIEPSSGHQIGEDAKLRAVAERATKQKASASPRRVDFGPFQAGFLSSPTGMSGVQRPRPRNGMGLPMGVKFTQRIDSHRAKAWTPIEDNALTSCVLRFGYNWHLCASEVNAASQNVSPAVVGTLQEERAPRQCQERWESLVQRDSALAERASKIDTMTLSGDTSPREAATTLDGDSVKPNTIENLLVPLALVVPQSAKDQAGTEQAKEGTARNGARRSFAVLKKAATKRRDFPLSIPPGDKKTALAPSHPSHNQTIHQITSSVSGTRSEIWPLQVLETADKARRASATRPPSAVGPAIPSNMPTNHQPSPPPSAASKGSTGSGRKS